MIFNNIIQGQGITLMLVGMSVVFCALVILLFSMKGLKGILTWLHLRKMSEKGVILDGVEAESASKPGEIPAVVVAALAMTIILDEEEAHDEESLVLTLQAMNKPYSNWWMMNPPLDK
ncbi:OadG family protein [bacterium]|nr:OadG family protein [bacterium]